MSGRLAGKVAIVTGGATGIGREISKLYAAEGARVVIADIRADDAETTVGAIEGAGGEALFVPTNVTESSDVEELVATAESHFGRLDIMTANAGIMGRGDRKSLVDIPEDEFREIMTVNFDGVWLCFKHAIPAIRRAGGGAMTATASTAAHRGMPDLAAYCASKGAIVALVRAVALEVAPSIRVNAVSPGGVATELPAHTAELKGLDPASQPKPRVEGLLIAQPREMATAHLFLVSDDSSFVNGQALIADGGRSIAF